MPHRMAPKKRIDATIEHYTPVLSPSMIRRLFMLLSAISLLLCIATCALWAAGERGPQLRGSWLFRGDRYTSSLSPQGLALLGPPPQSPDPAVRQMVDDLARELRENDGGMRFDGYTYLQYGVEFVWAKRGQPLWQQPLAGGDAAGPVLLSALEDPKHFVEAHLLLSTLPTGEKYSPFAGMDFNFSLVETPEGHRWRGVYDTLHITLVEDARRFDAGTWGEHMRGVVQADPGDMARVRDLWHSRLDVPIARATYPVAAAALFVLPAMRTLLYVRRLMLRRRRRSTGQCVRCGYDLRASPDCCPECGKVPAGR